MNPADKRPSRDSASIRTPPLIISDGVVTEFAPALSVKLRTATTVAQFDRLRQQVLRTVLVASSNFHSADHLAQRAPLTLCAGDALLVAIAMATEPAIRTTGRRLVNAAASIGVTVEVV